MQETGYAFDHEASMPVRPDDERLLFEPNISINGMIGEGTVAFFLDRLQEVRQSGQDMIVELNTAGGDADAARRIALEVGLFRRHSKRRAFCVGKTRVYSAGVTILASFGRESRFLTSDTVLLVHERRLTESVNLDGPIKSCIQIIREQLAMLETAEQLELDGFGELVKGSSLSTEELYRRATENCYMKAAEALELGLIERIIG